MEISKKHIIVVAKIALVVLVTVILFFLFLRPRHEVRDLPQILKSGRLVVVTDSSSLGFANIKDSVYGFQYEIIKAFADSLGVELQISEQNDMKETLQGLKDGEYDIVANFTPAFSEFKKGLTFIKPFFTTRQMFVQRLEDKDSSRHLVRKQYDLAKDTIYLPFNSLYKIRIEHLANEIADTIKVIEVKNVSTEAMVSMVAQGRIKNTICPEIFASRALRKYPNLDISLPLGFKQEYGWVVNAKSKDLAEKLNNFLTDFTGSSAYWELFNKYY
ncbi:MAG: transporter substrate-binding domain-containing protein [Paludibacter sp.]|nr:transporter substrate-binding domain-containing protein [Paludibacter sp.]